MSTLKQIFKAIIPHGLVELRRAAIAARRHEMAADSRAAFHAERKRRIALVQAERIDSPIHGDNYEEVMAFLKECGVPENHLRDGSMPPASLEFIRETAISRLGGPGPFNALHIGNFVGVSLAYVGAALTQRHPDSLIIAIDPNLTHRGITDPQAYVSALLSACGLQKNTLILAGYSGSKSLSNDGVIFDGYDPARGFSNEFACEESLRNLRRLCTKAFQFALIDGNHEANYVVDEIRDLLPLLSKGALIVLDDVDEAWSEIRDVFTNMPTFGIDPIGTDGRVGIAQLRAEVNSAAGD